jgi:sugar (pentulose or hexulose) kinase
MTISTDVVIGIDIGTTSSKAVARSASRRGTPYVEQPTPWHTPGGGQTEIDPYRLVDVAVDLIGRTVRAAEPRWGPVRVRGIGVTGLAESGVLLDAAGRPTAPVIAWFDHRGGHELEQLGREAPGLAPRFERTTGLRWSSQASLAKLLWLRTSGHRAGPGSTWLSVPEWIVFALGGDPVRVTGDGRTQDDVVIRIQDGATPAAIWTASVRYTAAQTQFLLDDIEKVVGPHRRAVAAGGWTQMASVRAAEAAVIDALSFSPVVQPGVTGAALLAAFALDGEGLPLADFIRQSTKE